MLTSQQPIVVVEDDTDTQEALTDVLTSQGYSVIAMVDGAVALQRLLDGALPRPGLLVCDLRLPTISGMELVNRLRADVRFTDLPIAIMSGMSTSRVVCRIGEGLWNVPKPVSVHQLLALVIRLCGERLPALSTAPLPPARRTS